MHRGPFVMAKFMDVSGNTALKNKPVAIQCRAWARNLNARSRSGESREVFATFSLLHNPNLKGRSTKVVTRLDIF